MPDAAVAAAETKAAPAAEAKASASKSRRPGGGTIDISMFTGAQRAATVIIALGAERASALYKHMEPEDVGITQLRESRGPKPLPSGAGRRKRRHTAGPRNAAGQTTQGNGSRRTCLFSDYERGIKICRKHQAF